MLSNVENIWHAGFAAGERYMHACPYPHYSNESNIWRAGWVQGILKSHGCAYRDEPLGIEANESMKDLIRW